MQFLMLVKADENAGMPPQALFEAMDKYVEKQVAAGVLVNTGGLMHSSQGVEVRIRGGKLQVVDGPFAESKEVIGGYAIVKAESREEAIAMSKEFMQMHLETWPGWEGTSEVRQIAEMFE